MKPYTERPTCLKCKNIWNARVAKVTYCDGKQCATQHIPVPFDQQPMTGPLRLEPVPEHLHCRCENCGYEWLMQCADAKPPDNPVQDIRCPHCSLHISLTIRDNQATAKSYGPHI